MKNKGKRLLIREIWTILYPYFVSKEWLKAWPLLVISLGISFISPFITAYSTIKSGEILSFAVGGDGRAAYSSLTLFLIALMLAASINLVGSWARNQLQNNWRRWMTLDQLSSYFERRNYYQLKYETEIDNPDQRIQEDISTSISTGFGLISTFVSVTANIAATVTVILTLSSTLLIAGIVYALVATMISLGVFRKILTRIEYLTSKREANLRFSLIRVRDNAESIAFYQGEKQESAEINRRLDEVVEIVKKEIKWSTGLYVPFTMIFQTLPSLLTIFVLGPSILAGQIPVGAFMTGSQNLSTLNMTLGILVSILPTIAQLSAAAQRLSALKNFCEKTPEPDSAEEKIKTVEGDRVAFTDLSLNTPDGNNVLFAKLNFELLPEKRLMVVGDSGAGKSSLLRAIAGLWSSGTGQIVRPELDQVMFLPQRPYMLQDTLRAQLMYPNFNRKISDEELLSVLKKVNLPDLAQQVGGLDNVVDFGSILSIGEQQRLAFAGLLLSNSKFAILDEATSALDVKNEQNLYSQITKNSTTLISVGHRPTIAKYHDRILQIKTDQSWGVFQPKDYDFKLGSSSSPPIDE